MQEAIKNYQNVLVKNFKDQFITMNIKQNMRTKIQQMNTDIFLNQILLESIDIVNRKLVFIQMKMTMLKDLKLDRIIDNYNIIINGKNFYDLAIDLWHESI